MEGKAIVMASLIDDEACLGEACRLGSARLARKDLEGEFVDVIPALRAFARLLCRDPTLAEDLVQETLLKGWANRDRFVPGTNLRSWLFTILKNTHVSALRKARWEVGDLNGPSLENQAVEPNQLDVVHLHDTLCALQTLSPKLKNALMAILNNGGSFEAAARDCECPVNTMKSRAARARAKLAFLLADEISKRPLL